MPDASKFDRLNPLTERMQEDVKAWFTRYRDWLAKELGVDPDGKSSTGRKSVPALPREEMIAEAEVLSMTLMHHMKELAAAGADIVNEDWNPDLANFDVTRQEAWLRKAAQNNALRLDAAMVDLMAEAMKDPETWEEGIRRALSYDDELHRWTNTIATESASFGENDAAKAAGLTKKTWIVTSDNPRDSHVAQSGMTIDIDDVFPNSQRYPGDYTGDFSDVANCQCRLSFSRPNELLPLGQQTTGDQIARTFATSSLDNVPIPELTEAEAAAVHEYTMGQSGLLNSWLRRKAGWNPEWGPYPRDPLVDRLLTPLSELMKRSEFTKDVKLTRQVPVHVMQEIWDTAQKEGAEKVAGLTFRDDAFLSTSYGTDSVNPDVFGQIRLNIHAPAGTRGAYIGEASYFGDEQREVLLAPGNSLRILAARKEGQLLELDVALIQDRS